MSKIPPLPGIYAIRHADGSIYVGSSMNLRARCSDWDKTEHSGAVFHVVETIPGADNNALRQREEVVLARVFERAPDRIRNANRIARLGQYSELSAFGKSQPISAWESETGLGRNTIYGRLAAGWSPERALSEPAVLGRKTRDHDAARARLIAAMATRITGDNQQPMLVVEAAEAIGVTKESLEQRLRTLRNRQKLESVTLADLRGMRWRKRPE